MLEEMIGGTFNAIAAKATSAATAGEPIAPKAGHVLFESPTVTYTPFAPGGTINGSVDPGRDSQYRHDPGHACILQH